MSPIEWPTRRPKSSPPEDTNQVFLPELELTDADYEAAGEALRKLEDCSFEVVFVHEVAARHCRERQLRELLRSQTFPASKRAPSKDFIKQLETPTQLSQLRPFRKPDSPSKRTKKLP